MFQVDTILFEQDQQVRVVAYQMFRYSRVRLTEIEAVNGRDPSKSILSPHPACRYVIKDKNRIWVCLARWNDIAVAEHKVANFIDRHK